MSTLVEPVALGAAHGNDVLVEHPYLVCRVRVYVVVPRVPHEQCVSVDALVHPLGLVFLPLLPRNDVGGISGKLPEQLGDKAIDRNAKHHAQNKRDKAAHYCHDELRSGN